MKSLLAAGGIDSVVQEVARRITVRFPPVVANNPERTVSLERTEEILEDTFAGALQLEPENRIGFFRRMWLKNALRGELREIGYEENFVDFAVEKFIEQLLRKVA